MGKERGEASMKNIFKVVLLFVVGFGFLIYLTIPSNIKEDKNQKELELKNLPSSPAERAG